MARGKSRPQRWADAAGDASKALSEMESSKDAFVAAMDELKSIQDEYIEWKDNLPENMASSPMGDKLEEVSNLDLESAADAIGSAIDDARSIVDEAEGIDLPRGFGKD